MASDILSSQCVSYNKFIQSSEIRKACSQRAMTENQVTQLAAKHLEAISFFCDGITPWEKNPTRSQENVQA